MKHLASQYTRQITFILCFVFLSMTMAAQDVTTFLDIPVDGTKTEMKKRLLEKGFEYNDRQDCFTGEFNGHDVELFVRTYNNKVWRIAVCDANTCGEQQVKINFNNLCRQFVNNKRYVEYGRDADDFTIPAEEDVAYGILIGKKVYEACFHQQPDFSRCDTTEMTKIITESLQEKFTQEQISNPTKRQQKEMTEAVMQHCINMAEGIIDKKTVWFRIMQLDYKYCITLFYDNEYNRTNGEEL